MTTEDRTCKRCSVARVNSLVEAYRQAHGHGDQRRLKSLDRVAAEVKAQGYDQAVELLRPGLDDKTLRALCWNVSSFLTDQDMVRFFG